MDYHKLILFLLLSGCTLPPPEAADAVDALGRVCCGGTAEIVLPADTSIYTTEEAVCLQKQSQLSCSACACPVTAQELAKPGNGRKMTCTFGTTIQCVS